ncbi:hypothetical protein WJX75_002505 [Coccomyxa subellipsoidea]|uniref:Uncharacterized protein n=1 Tax=Coccomyxa subellipsoidea TaxID=248742 RepID=A0ABR2YX55_9CHLO
MIVIQHDYQSLLVGFRGIVEGSLRHPSSAQVSVTAQELRAEAGGWQIHELQLPGQCMRRSLLWAGQDSKQAVSGSAQPLVCILLGCRCSAVEAEGHALLELQYSPQAGWRAEELAQSAAVRPTAICQQGPRLTGVSTVAVDQSGLGIFIDGQAGWLAKGEVHRSAAAFLDSGASAGAPDIVKGMRRPAFLLPHAVAAPGKEEVEAAEGMRAVLGALRRRLEGGCQAVQDAEQLAARKAALLRTSLQLLHTHCSRTFQASHSTPIQPAASTLAASDQRSGKGELRPAHGSSQPAAAADGVTKAPVLVCEELSATLEGGRCAVRAQLRDRAPLGVIAVVPLWDSTSAGRSAHSGASNSGSGLVAIPAQNGYHMQHMAGEQRSAVRLCLEADKGSVGDVPKLLETALGLRLEWLTSHGARLSAVDSSTGAE